MARNGLLEYKAELRTLRLSNGAQTFLQHPFDDYTELQILRREELVRRNAEFVPLDSMPAEEIDKLRSEEKDFRKKGLRYNLEQTLALDSLLGAKGRIACALLPVQEKVQVPLDFNWYVLDVSQSNGHLETTLLLPPTATCKSVRGYFSVKKQFEKNGNGLYHPV